MEKKERKKRKDNKNMVDRVLFKLTPEDFKALQEISGEISVSLRARKIVLDYLKNQGK